MRIVAMVLALGLWSAAPVTAQTPSLAELQIAAEDGDAAAQVQLAEVYRRGQGVPQNYARAAEWFEAAAAQGDPAAQNGLAGLLAKGFGVPRDPERAFELISAAAASGTPEFVSNLATVYEFGIGTAPDPARAAALYAEAYEKGWLPAAVSLGVMLQEGNGVPVDIPRARDLYTIAAEAGDPRAQNNLGLIYTRGAGGVETDYAKAREWLTKAAEQGMPEALRNLAVIYENGFGVPADEEQAKRLYRLAALRPGERADAEGDADGVALLYDPRLLPPDPAQAQAYALAADAGDPVALFLMGYLLANAARTGADHRTAAGYFRQAAARGSSAAMANLGLMMFDGRGVLQDYVEGYKWLSLAAVGGLPGAAAARDRLADRMTPDQINAANAAAAAAWSGETAAPGDP